MDWIEIETKGFWWVLAVTFIAVAVWETSKPHRSLLVESGRRWRNHGIVWLGYALTASLFGRATPVLMAAWVADSRFGLLNRPWAPLFVRWILGLLLLDLVRYAAHVGLHKIPGLGLWRLHEIHHSDPDFDLSTGLRAHPLEILYSQLVYLSATAILAPPLSAVLAAEFISLFMSLFGHANASLPPRLERWSRFLFVSPDMHRIHHSTAISEQNTNFGDIFPWWDHLFGTYCADPEGGQANLTVGIEGHLDPHSLDLSFLLTRPFHARSNDASESSSTTV